MCSGLSKWVVAQFAVRRSPFAVRRSPFAVRRTVAFDGATGKSDIPEES